MSAALAKRRSGSSISNPVRVRCSPPWRSRSRQGSARLVAGPGPSLPARVCFALRGEPGVLRRWPVSRAEIAGWLSRGALAAHLAPSSLPVSPGSSWKAVERKRDAIRRRPTQPTQRPSLSFTQPLILPQTLSAALAGATWYQVLETENRERPDDNQPPPHPEEDPLASDRTAWITSRRPGQSLIETWRPPCGVVSVVSEGGGARTLSLRCCPVPILLPSRIAMAPSSHPMPSPLRKPTLRRSSPVPEHAARNWPGRLGAGNSR